MSVLGAAGFGALNALFYALVGTVLTSAWKE